MINKNEELTLSLKSITGQTLDEEALTKILEDSGSTFGEMVDSLMKNFVAVEYDLDILTCT